MATTNEATSTAGTPKLATKSTSTSTIMRTSTDKSEHTAAAAAAAAPSPSHNIFRDSALRYAGYANEIGESFRYQIPRLVAPTYVIAFAYVCADAISTGHETWKNSTRNATTTTTTTLQQQQQGARNDTNSNSVSISSNGISKSNINSNSNTVWHDTIYATADTLLWQTLASVVMPGATINLVVKASRYAVHRYRSAPLLLLLLPGTAAVAVAVAAKKWLPTVIGIGSIPLIVQPIDRTVDYMLDNSTRHWWNNKQQQQQQAGGRY
jgi:fission process protein 1